MISSRKRLLKNLGVCDMRGVKESGGVCNRKAVKELLPVGRGVLKDYDLRALNPKTLYILYNYTL